jgi:hypothetical protein
VKKIALICSLGLMLWACSVPDFSNILSPVSAPTPAPTNTVYLAPSSTATLTATMPTPTFTGTPTLMGGGFTDTPTLDSTELAETPSVTGSPMDTTSNPIIPGISLGTPPGVGFTSVKISGNLLHWGGCEPSSIIFTAHVADPVNEVAVLLFLRLKSPTTGEMTKWGAGAIMNGDSTGTFTYTVTVNNVIHYADFPGAWLQYQFVALGAHFSHVGYTQPYLSSITVSRCQ